MTITSTYASFLLDTGPTYVSGPEKRVNDVARLNYETLGFLSRGKKMERVVQGGSSIKDQILLSITPRARNIGILDQTTPNITETGVNAEAFWRIAQTHIAWDERVRFLNRASSVGTDGGAQKFKDMRHNDFQEMYTDWENLLDNNLWAPADFGEMEGTSGVKPYSIPALINEFANGLVPATTGTTAWTSKYGVASTVAGFTNYQAQRFTYNNLNVASNTNLIHAFDVAYESLAFKAPPTNKQYFEPNSEMLPAQMFIACSKEGTIALKELCRNSQDSWNNQTDAYGGRPTFAGVPVVSVALLTTAAIYPTGTSGAYGVETTTTNGVGGYRYHLINSNYLDFIVNSEYWFKVTGQQEQQGNPSRKTIFYETFNNLWAKSLRRHGIIHPNANVV